ncbi:MAG: OmcA/MtrC family decaheme c-type cytochrome [Acidobacteriota bacterium]
MTKKAWYQLLTVAFLLVVLVGLSAATLDQLSFSKFDKRHYLTDQQIAFIRPGLTLEVLDVSVATDRSVSVTYKITDPKGLPLDREGILTPGNVNTSFIMAYIPNDQNQYVNLTTRTTAASPISGVSAIQGSADSGGTTIKVSDGVYKYTLKTRLPEGFDPTATHSIGLVFYRDLSEFGLSWESVNEVVNFRPDGGPVTKVRDVVTTETCKKCHDDETFGFHSHGARATVEVCVLCHNPQTIDPDSGESQDMAVFIHKIHRGKDLPSVVAGKPYIIYGNQMSVHNYSGVGYPQDIRNCESCHDPASGATQQEAYLLRPSRAACGSCHDDVNFATGANHANGLVQTSDKFCANCHWPEGELEFDASIKGAHVVPTDSKQLPGVNLEIVEITNTAPGQKPTVTYRLKNDAGQPILPTELNSFSLLFAGPTTDYTTMIRESAAKDSVASGDAFTYTFKAGIPAGATGTFFVSGDAYRNTKINPGQVKEQTVRDPSVNPLLYFGVTDATPVPRRQIVSDAKCDSCHKNLALHGGQRFNPEYCVACHFPGNTDEAQRPADKMPARSIDMKFMIHRIHTGEELKQPYLIYGHNNSEHQYNEVLYPADRRNCEKCHLAGTYNVPSAGVEKTAEGREFYGPIPPNSAACLGCHDSLDAAAHTYLNTATFGESCGVCHGPDADFAVAKVHAR